MRRRRLLHLLVPALLAPACFRARTSDPRAGPPRIEVRSGYFGPVVVYVITGASQVRLGMVQSNQTTVFDFPAAVNAYSSGIRMLVDPIGESNGFLSESVSASPGTTIVLTIENELRYSHVIVR